MGLQYSQQELYGRALFSIDNNGQEVNVAFEPISNSEYLMVVFAEDASGIKGYHEPDFIESLNEIVFEFDSNRGLDYKVAAE